MRPPLLVLAICAGCAARQTPRPPPEPIAVAAMETPPPEEPILAQEELTPMEVATRYFYAVSQRQVAEAQAVAGVPHMWDSGCNYLTTLDEFAEQVLEVPTDIGTIEVHSIETVDDVRSGALDSSAMCSRAGQAAEALSRAALEQEHVWILVYASSERVQHQNIYIRVSRFDSGWLVTGFDD